MCPENSERLGNRSLSSPSLANTSLVPKDNADADRCATSVAPEFASASIQETSQAQTAQDPTAGGVSFIRDFYSNRGFSKESTDIFCASWRKSTTDQYQVYFRKWSNFCGRQKIDPLSPSEIDIVNFLTELFNNGECYSAINTARSALSVIISNDSGLTIGKFPSVKRFMKGVFELRPPLPRYNYIWDVNIVFSYLMNFYPYEGICLSILTFKLVMLLALTTAQRAQTLHVLNIEHFIFCEDSVLIPNNSLIKQSTVRNRKFSIHLKAYKADPSICVFEALKVYIERTKNLRQDTKQLFISFHKPHHAVSKQTISRWIKKVLNEAGIDVSCFGAHSTRSAASSKFKFNNVPIDDILKTAGWANNRTFQKYYDKSIMMDTN